MECWEKTKYANKSEVIFRFLPGSSAISSGKPVTADELERLMSYTPRDGEWPEHGREVECNRIAAGLEEVRFATSCCSAIL